MEISSLEGKLEFWKGSGAYLKDSRCSGEKGVQFGARGGATLQNSRPMVFLELLFETQGPRWKFP
jgi:hypothetical protein